MKPQFELVTGGLSARFVTMWPDLVDALLALNTRNRNQRPLVVQTYERALRLGLWIPTNQGIGVSASGFLIDGQHRLEALRAAGYPVVTMLLVTGLPDAAMGAVDAGANRSPRDYLQFMFDTKVSSLVPAVLRASMLARDRFQTGAKYQPHEYAEHLEAIGDGISELLKIEFAWRLNASVLAALVDAYMRGHADDVIAFTKALTTGAMLERDNPALLLRNWLSTSKNQGGNTRLTERYRKTTRALEIWITGRPITKLYRTKEQIAPAGGHSVKLGTAAVHRWSSKAQTAG